MSRQNLDIFILHGNLKTDSDDPIYRLSLFGRKYLMNIIIKRNGVSDETKARLAQFLLNPDLQVKTTSEGPVYLEYNNLPTLGKAYPASSFRLIKDLQSSIEEGGTHHVTLRVCYSVWEATGKIHYLSNELHREFLQVFEPGLLPSAKPVIKAEERVPDADRIANMARRQEIVKKLLVLKGRRLPFDIYYSDYRPFLSKGTVLTLEVLFSLIYTTLDIIVWGPPDNLKGVDVETFDSLGYVQLLAKEMN